MKKPKAPTADDLTDEQVGALISLAMLERRQLEEKLKNCIERLHFFSKGRPLLPVLVNEAYLLLRHAARLGVTPSYYQPKKKKAKA